MSFSIEELAAMPIDSLNSYHWGGLRVGGHDKYSRWSGHQIYEATTKVVRDEIAEAIQDSGSGFRSALRWYLRGLPVSHAIAKAQYDLDISHSKGQQFLESPQKPQEPPKSYSLLSVLVELMQDYHQHLNQGGSPVSTLGEFLELPTGDNVAGLKFTYRDKAVLLLSKAKYPKFLSVFEKLDLSRSQRQAQEAENRVAQFFTNGRVK